VNATPFGAGGFWRMASLLVGYDAQGIAPSSRLALRQNPLRLGRCREQVWALGADRACGKQGLRAVAKSL